MPSKLCRDTPFPELALASLNTSTYTQPYASAARDNGVEWALPQIGERNLTARLP